MLLIGKTHIAVKNRNHKKRQHKKKHDIDRSHQAKFDEQFAAGQSKGCKPKGCGHIGH